MGCDRGSARVRWLPTSMLVFATLESSQNFYHSQEQKIDVSRIQSVTEPSINQSMIFSSFKMPLFKCFAPSTILLILASMATNTASCSPGVDYQHPVQLPHSYKNFSAGFSLQSSFGAAAIIFENSYGTAETYTRTQEGGYLYRQVMAKLSLRSSQHVAYVSPIPATYDKN